MEYEFVKFPTSVRSLSEELVRCTNDYYSRKIGNDEISEIIKWYASKCADLLFRGQDYSPTLKKIIGQRRLRLLDHILEDYEFNRFKGVK